MPTTNKRRIRNYVAMSEKNLRSCYKDFHAFFYDQSLRGKLPEAVELCFSKGSNDPWRDYQEIIHIADIRMIDLEDYEKEDL